MDKDQSLSPLPANIELITEYDGIVIRRTWKSPVAYFLVFFAFIWNAFMVVWMTIALSSGAWEMAAFGSIHASVGIGLIYYTIALFLNRTDIRIDGYKLSVKHFPIPWFGQLETAVENIKQVYCKKKISHSKNGTNVTYALHYIDKNNRDQKLLSGLNDSTQAHFVEKEIERTLGIKDQSVSGEFK